MRARVWVAVAAAVAGLVAARRSVSAQRAERDLWAEATDDVGAATPSVATRSGSAPRSTDPAGS